MESVSAMHLCLRLMSGLIMVPATAMHLRHRFMSDFIDAHRISITNSLYIVTTIVTSNTSPK